MNSSKFTMTLDLHTSQSQYSISARLGDTNRKLLINLTDGGVPYKIPDGCYAYVSIKRPNGVPFEEDCVIKDNTVIEYQFRKNTAAMAGIHTCDLTLCSLEGEVLGSPKFTLVVNDRAVKDDTLDTSTEPWRIIDAAVIEETKRQHNENLRVEAEDKRVAAEENRKAQETIRQKAEAERNKTFGDAWGLINYNDKRLTNLERGYEDELVVSAGSPAAPYWTVPENALPYAEIKKIYGRGYKESDGTFVTHKIVRVESCKYAEKEALDATLDLSEMVDTMTVEKLSDGSFKFSGYTNGAACKFATVTLPAGYYGINYKVVSGDYNDSVHITAKNTDVKEDVFYHWGWFSINEGESLNLSIDYNQASGALADYVLAFEIQKGQWDGHEAGSFVPGLEPIATLDIPQEIYDKEWYGMHAYNFVDLENGKLVITRKIVDGTIITLSEPEEIDVRGILRPDNLLAVVPGGIIRVIQNTRDGNSKCEIEFMLKGV